MGTMHGARQHWRALALSAAGALVAAAVLFLVLPRVIDYGDLSHAFAALTWWWLAALIAAATLNIVTFAPPLMAVLPGVRFRPALAVTLSSTASTYVAPGGPAVGMALTYAMLRGWGFRGKAATLAVTLMSVWNLLFTFSAPSVALVALSLTGESHPLLRTASTGGLVVFAAIIVGLGLVLAGDRPACWLGDRAASVVSVLLRLLRRGPVSWSGRSFADFREDAIDLLRARWHWLTLATIAGHLTVYLVLLVTLRATGIPASDVGYVESFAAWSLARVLAALPITPGGIGVVELGLTGALLAFGGGNAAVVAAVLIYRALTIVPPLVLGALSAATWRRHHPGWAEDPA